MGAMKQTDLAIRLGSYLMRFRDQVELTNDFKDERPFAVALYVVASVVIAAIFNGTLLEFSEHCCEFARKMAKGDEPKLVVFEPVPLPESGPSAN